MSYYANIDSPENRAFKTAYKARYGDKAPILALIGVDCYSGVKFIQAVVTRAKGTQAAKVAEAARGLSFDTPTGRMTMNNRHVDKNMYLAECRATEFQVVETFKNVKSGQTCA
jgi:ABC-type branched-subunit amino acid transport system substrate-binding protein